MQAKLRELAAIIGPENFFTDPACLAAYGQGADFSGRELSAFPLAVARPGHPRQAAKLLKACADSGIRILIRGSGTEISRNDSASGAIVLTTTGMSRIYEIDSENRLVSVQAGAPVAAVQEAAARKNLFLPIASPVVPVATIGGVVAANSASSKYGPPANWIRSLSVLTASGEQLDCAANAAQIGAGFPLAPIFCGSGGCLGLISDLTISLLPVPQARRAFAFAFADEAGAAGACVALLESGIDPEKLEFYDAACAASLLRNPAWNKPLLAIACAGPENDVEGETALAKDIFAQNGGEETALDNCAVLPCLAAGGRRLVVETAVSPPALFPQLLNGLREIAAEQKVKCAIFGWPRICRLRAAFFLPLADPAAIGKRIFALQLTLNNALASEAEAEMEPAKWQKQRELYALSEKLRALFDPGGVFAPARLPGELP